MKKLLSLVLALAIVFSCVSMVSIFAGGNTNVGVKLTAKKDVAEKQNFNYVNAGFTAGDVVNGKLTKTYKVYNPTSHTVKVAVEWRKGWDEFTGFNGENKSAVIPANSSMPFTLSMPVAADNTIVYDNGSKTAELSSVVFRIDVWSAMAAGESIYVAWDGYDKQASEFTTGGDAFSFESVASMPAIATKTVVNGDAENGTTGWSSIHGGSTTVVADPADANNKVAMFNPNNSKYASVAFNIGAAIVKDADYGYVGGGAGDYILTFKAKAETGKSGEFSFVLNSKNHLEKAAISEAVGYTAEESSYKSFTTEKVALTDQWNTYEINFTVEQSWLNLLKDLYESSHANAPTTYDLVLRLDGSALAYKDGTYFNYYLDDVKIEKASTDPVGVKFEITENFEAGFPIWRKENVGFTQAMADANNNINLSYDVYNVSPEEISLEFYLQKGWSPTYSQKVVTIPAGQKVTYTETITTDGNGNVVKNGETFSALSELGFRVDIRNSSLKAAGSGFIIAAPKGDILYNLDDAIIMSGNGTGKTAKTFVTSLPGIAAPTPVTDKAVVNGDVENGSIGWGVFSAAGGSLTVVEPGADGTGHAAKFTASGAYDSVAFDLGPAIINVPELGYVGGGAGKYTVTFKAKAEAGKGGKFHFLLNSQAHMNAGNQVSVNGVVKPLEINSFVSTGKFVELTDQWQTFTATVDVTEQFIATINDIYNSEHPNAKDAYKLILRLDGGSYAFKESRFAYFVDDVTIAKADTATTAPATATPTAKPTEPVGLELKVSQALGTSANFYYLSAEGMFSADETVHGTKDVTYTIYNTSDKAVNVEYSIQCTINGSWQPTGAASSIVKKTIPAGGSETFTYTVENIEQGKITKTYSGKTEQIGIEKLMARFGFTFEGGEAIGDSIIVAAAADNVIYKKESSLRKITATPVYELPGTTPVATATPVVTTPPTVTTAPADPTPTPTGEPVGVKVEVVETLTGYPYLRVDPAGITQDMADADGNIVIKTDFYNTNDYAIIVNAQVQNGWNPIIAEERKEIPANSKATITLTIATDGNGNAIKGATLYDLAKLSYRFQLQNESIKTAGTEFYVAGNQFVTKVGNPGLSASGGKAVKTLVYELPDLTEATPAPTPTPTPVADKVVFNGDAENGLTNWGDFSAAKGGTVELVQPGADGTGNAVKYTASSKYQTLTFDLGPAIINAPEHGYNGGGAGVYTIKFKAKTDANDTSNVFMLILNSQAHANKGSNMGSFVSPMNTYISTSTRTLTTDWQEYSFKVTVTQEFLDNLKNIYEIVGKKEAYQLVLRLDGASYAFKDSKYFSYYLDDVSIEKDKEPAGIKMTTKELYTSDHYMIGKSKVLANEPTFTGQKAITYVFYNTSDVNMSVSLSMQVSHKTAAGSDYWADAGKVASGVVAAGKKLTLTFTTDVENGKVTVTNGGATARYNLEDLFLRINVKTMGATEGGKTLVIGANSKDDMLYTISSAMKGTVEPTADIPYDFEETVPADFAPKKENMNAENGLVNWGTIHGGKVELVQPGAAGTGNAVKFTPNNAAGKYNSLAFDLGPWIIWDKNAGYKGGGAGKYEVTFYAKADKAGKFNVMLNSQLHDSQANVQKYLGKSAAVGATYTGGQPIEMTTKWKKYTVTLDVKMDWYQMILKLNKSSHPNAALAYQLALRFDGATQAFKNGAYGYQIDQISIKKVASYTNETPVGVELEALKDHNASAYFITQSGYATKADVKDGVLTKTVKIKNTGTEDIMVQFELQATVKPDGKAVWAAPVTGDWVEVPAGEEVEITYECEVDNGKVDIQGEEVKIEDLFARFNVKTGDGNYEFVKGTKFQIRGTNANEYKKFAKLSSSSSQNWQITPIYEKSLKTETGDALPVAMISVAVVAIIGLGVVVKAKKKEN